MHRFPDFPATPEELTPAWLTSVCRAHGLHIEVDTLTHHRIGTGQIGQNHRYAITYTDPEGASQGGAPTSLVGKFVSPDPTSRTTGLMMGIYAKEATFYQQLAPSLAGRMRVPRCWVSEFDVDREATLVLMEDLAPAVQGDQMEACSVGTAELAVQELAALHSTFWEHDVLTGIAELGDPTDPMRAMILKHLMNEHWPAFIDRYRTELTDDMIAVGNQLTACIDQWVLGRTGPLTLTHNDYRADNLMITAAWTAAVDWQTVSVGWAGTDLGYFLGASLLPDDRRANQERLIDQWHQRLVENGVTNYSRAAAWDDYRHGQFAGFVTAVVSSMITQRTDRGDAMFWAMAGRHLETALETNAAQLLPG
jgi:aminoglycoside/choline kinase family phosphotransferase